ncbi:hypothetical protein CRG98_044232 [Punica granatum]|uniref:O-methyltransferase domain-containing protein n=1 Tax=Punica granatum TaxID=22663 RepID=A0A2I0HUI5_PUNGR|nr:hypothetical protein CRG98_044232 [Punica granatum]
MRGRETNRRNSSRRGPSSYSALTSFLLLTLFFLLSRPSTPTPISDSTALRVQNRFPLCEIPPFDCYKSPQAHLVIANLVEGLKHPFLYSLSDFGTWPDKPHKNTVRMLEGKLFRKPNISVTMQEVLERLQGGGKEGLAVDVGANVGMASFAAAVMGFRRVLTLRRPRPTDRVVGSGYLLEDIDEQGQSMVVRVLGQDSTTIGDGDALAAAEPERSTWLMLAVDELEGGRSLRVSAVRGAKLLERMPWMERLVGEEGVGCPLPHHGGSTAWKWACKRALRGRTKVAEGRQWTRITAVPLSSIGFIGCWRAESIELRKHFIRGNLCEFLRKLI